jgi:hypothetical protein
MIIESFYFLMYGKVLETRMTNCNFQISILFWKNVELL